MRRPGKRQDVPAALAEAGGNLERAAKLLGREVRFVKRWAERAKTGEGFGNKPGGGRKCLVDADGARFARRTACKGRRVCCKTIAKRLFDTGHTTRRVCAETVRRALRRGSHGLVYKRLDKRQRLTQRHRVKRVAWAERYLHKPFGDWMWTDSKIFLEQKVSSKGHWQHVGQQPTVEVDKHPNKIHAYAGLTSTGVTTLYPVTGTTGLPSRGTRGVGAAEYSEVIENHLIPEGNRIFQGRPFTVYEDGAPAHTSRLASQTWNKYSHVRVVRSAPCSPDLNPLENLWSIVDDRLLGVTYPNRQAFMKDLQKQWGKITAAECKRLCSSMPRRLQKVISVQGGHIERNTYT